MNTFVFSSFRFRSILPITRMFVLIPFCLLCFAQTPDDVSELSEAHPVERTLKGGETHTYQMNLKAGQFMRAEVNQSPGLDVIVSLFAPDGKVLIETNAKNGYLWRETVSCIARSGGTYKLEIKPIELNAIAASYTLTIVEVRKSNEQDRSRIAAEQAFSEGRRLYLQKYQATAEVIKQYEVALGLWREIGDRYWEAVALTNLGWGQSDLSQNDKAINSLNQALRIFQAIKDRQGEGKALNGMGGAYKDLKQYERAIEFYEQALAIRKEVRDRRGEGGTLLNLGIVHKELKQYERAQYYDEQGLAIFREMKNRPLENAVLLNLGFVYSQLQKLDKVKECLERALAISRELKDQPGERNTLNLLGLYYTEFFKQYEEARTHFEQALVLDRKLQDKDGESEALLYLGQTYVLHLGNCDKAREYLEQALTIKRALKDKKGEGVVLSNLVTTSLCLGQNEKLREYSERALVIKKELQDKVGQIPLLTGLGSSYDSSGLHEKARSYFEQSLLIAREEKQRTYEIITLDMLANNHMGSNEYEKARDLYEQAVSLAKESNDKYLCTALSSLAGAYAALKQDQKAKETYEQALALARDTQDRNKEGDILVNFGHFYAKTYQLDKAQSCFEQALAAAKATQNKFKEASILNDLGSLYKKLNEYDKALGAYEESLKIARDNHNLFNENFALVYLASLHSNLNQYEKAEEYAERSLRKSQETNFRVLECITLIIMGNNYLNLNQYEKARDHYEQGMAISKELKHRELEGSTKSGLGAIDVELSQNQRAQSNYEMSLALMKEVLNRRGEGQIHNSLGATYLNLKQYDKAKDYFEQALAIAREVKEKADEAYPLINLGEVYANLDQPERSRSFYEQGLAAAKVAEQRSIQSYALNGLGDLQQKLNQPAKAEIFYEQALALAREIQNKKIEGRVLWNLMLLNQKTRPQLAVLYGKQAINAFQEIRGNIKRFDKDSQQSFLKDKESAYRTLADILVTQGRLPEAERVLDMLKEEEFSDIKRGIIVLNIHLNPNEDKAAASSDQLARLAVELSDLNERFGKGIATKSDRERVKFIDARITEANKEIKAVLIEVAEAAPRKQELDEHSLGIMGTLRSLGNGTVALYTVVTKEKGWVILTTPDFRRSYPIDVSDLEKRVYDFRQTLKSEQYDPVRNAQTLYRALFLQPNNHGRTLAADLRDYGAKTLMWSLDGVLRYFPMAALHDGQKYLVEQYRNVVFTGTDETRLAASGSNEWSVLGLGVSKPYADFPALRAVPRELHAIIRDSQSSAVGVLPGVIRLDEAFTRDSLIDGLRERRPVLHIASHVIFDVARPAASFLLLGDGNHLTLEDLKVFPQYFANIELLTLSACDTAVRGKANGKDAEGFAYAALGLGAKSVVASLWSVSDEGTEVLMREFYRIKSAHPQMSKAEALQRAQLALIAGASPQFSSGEQRKATAREDASGSYATFKRDPKARFGHPHYWAPFVLIGNWK